MREKEIGTLTNTIAEMKLKATDVDVEHKQETERLHMEIQTLNSHVEELKVEQQANEKVAAAVRATLAEREHQIDELMKLPPTSRSAFDAGGVLTEQEDGELHKAIDANNLRIAALEMRNRELRNMRIKLGRYCGMIVNTMT